jgi:glycosyltransferase involved in cell wall biosynthesis
VPLALSIAVHRPAWRSLVSAYIFISASQRDLLGRIGLPPDRLFVRHNMIPRREPRLVKREHFVLYSGRLAEVKGLRLLMAAWDRYRSDAGDAGLRLVIAGAGPRDGEVADWAAARPSVELAGLVPSDRNAELMSQARAVLVPSIWEEPFGLVVVEAMAAGTPPIATDRGSFVELITRGVDGELFPPDDPAALASVIADIEARPARYEALGSRARETYEERFNPDHSLKHLLEIYNFAITNPADARRPRSQGKPESLWGPAQCNQRYAATSLPRHSAGQQPFRCGPWPWLVMTHALSGARSTGWCGTGRPPTSPTTWPSSTVTSSAGSCPRSPAPK